METIKDNERLFDAEDVFFSTTDRKGVIRCSNRIFVSLARHPREELIGAPHNIIRHDDMPAGVFKLLWDDLEAGRPVCTYVLNRAGDGLDYWVFATVSAVEDGYVSVRTKPLKTETLDAVREVYGRVRALERQADEEGASRKEVAERGAEALAAELAELGFDSLTAFSRAALPEEASLLVREGVKVPQREEAEGSAATILGLAAAIEENSEILVSQMAEYRALLTGLGEWAQGAPAIVERARRTGELVDILHSEDPESSVPNVAGRITERTSRAVERLGGLTDSVSALYDAVEDLVFHAPLMRLHTIVLGSYAAAVLDGTEEDVPTAMAELHHALAADLKTVAAVCTTLEEQIEAMDAVLREVVSDLDRTRRPFDRWLRALQDEGAYLSEGAEGDIEALLSEAQGLSSTGFPEVGALAVLAARCRGLDLSFDSEAMDSRVDDIRIAIETL
ncbi:MAG: diguanylate cyclase [Actinomyces sp.]|uniref:diguanylate cyclase n=1 Tax=Actinomyces sp. TaxID=29317 RepID=UPI0026DC4FC7|nr:diguanylate cyclase [Actinomyces sp.]MDO4243127.1 diguanylate cyclase [Actinomyces sp.]